MTLAGNKRGFHKHCITGARNGPGNSCGWVASQEMVAEGPSGWKCSTIATRGRLQVLISQPVSVLLA